jgi:hypothetical protein
MVFKGRDAAQALSRQPLTEETWIRSQEIAYDICDAQNGSGNTFLSEHHSTKAPK